MKAQRLLILIPLMLGLGNAQAERREFTYGVAAEIGCRGKRSPTNSNQDPTCLRC